MDHQEQDQLAEGVTSPSADASQVSTFDQLRAAREAHGWSQQEVASQLKFSLRQIDALERGDLAAVPQGPFLRGFVRSYAKLLRLNPDALLDGLGAAEAARVERPVVMAEFRDSPTVGQRSSAGGGLKLMAGLVLLAVLGAGAWMVRDDLTQWASVWWSDRQASGEEQSRSVQLPPMMHGAKEVQPDRPTPSPETITVLPLGVQVAPGQTAAGATPVLPGHTPRAVQTAAQGRLELRFAGESWVEIFDTRGKRLHSQLNQAGSVVQIAEPGPYQVKIGNAHDVEVWLGGKQVDIKPYIGQGSVARLKLE